MTDDNAGNLRSPEDADDFDGEGNTIVGGKTRAVVEHLASFLVSDPDALDVSVDERRRGEVEVLIAAGPGDVGRIIGRRGRVIQSIRQVARAAASTEQLRANVEIVDE
jgi:predicted RNA-binding protein YlqC (UPF0109 family)